MSGYGGGYGGSGYGAGRGGPAGAPPPRELGTTDPHLMLAPRNNRFGADGKPIEVIANCYDAELRPQAGRILHFDITYTTHRDDPQETPPHGGPRGRGRGRGGRGRGRGRGGRRAPDENPPPMPIATRLIRDIERDYSQRMNNAILAHDGKKNVYTSVDPGWIEQSFYKKLGDKYYEVGFKWVGNIELDELRDFMSGQTTTLSEKSLACLDIVLRTNPLRTMVYTGKAFAIAPETTTSEFDLGQGCEAWTCFYQAFKPQTNNLYLCFDVTHTAFYKQQSVYQYAVDLFDRTPLNVERPQDPFPNGINADMINRIKNELRGIRISKIGDTADRQYPIKDITLTGADALEFEDPDMGHRTTVAAHFEHHGERLHYPKMPCIDIRSGAQGHIYIPLEKAFIVPGQRRRKAMPDFMNAKMIQLGARGPEDRQSDIKRTFEESNLHTDKYLQAFGITVKNEPVRVPARILEPPGIEFMNEKLNLKPSEDTHDLGWSTKNRTFLSPRKLMAWGVLVTASTDEIQVHQFLKALKAIAEEQGMTVVTPIIKFGFKEVVANDLIKLKDEVDNAPVNVQNNTKCQLIMVIKEDMGTRDYAHIKNTGETYLGIPTQCVVKPHAESPKDLYLRNVLLKMNAKLGGVNFNIPRDSFSAIQPPPQGGDLRPKTNYMIMGLSISHAAAADAKGDLVSFAAMTATMNLPGTTIAGNYRIQTQKLQHIEDVSAMADALFQEFYNIWKTLPGKVVVYRDGCADGQFPLILQEECDPICSAAARVVDRAVRNGDTKLAGFQPKVTFIVLQKRHHTRFFPTTGGPADISANCVPGTVVDRKITHPINYDFYLISHNGIQGTSRPVRYILLRDQIGFSPDEIQKLTYHLCFTFCRSTNSISLAPSVYYAHLLANRGRVWQNARTASRRFETGPGQRIENLPESLTTGDPRVKPNLIRRLYYV